MWKRICCEKSSYQASGAS
ncbi:unnamed protein product [Larinioides sclopetarius]|uniref:Uncharacterized protein n=1 Tax=Larinioides sclopetarius TaxID=280406 RepID=A0AAV2B985_9ARAC